MKKKFEKIDINEEIRNLHEVDEEIRNLHEVDEEIRNLHEADEKIQNPNEANEKNNLDAIYDVIDDWKLVRTKRKHKPDTPFFRAILSDILCAAVIIGALFAFFWPAVVDGTSMEPTFLSGDYLIISRISAWTSNLNRGDFVACRIHDGERNITIIKRLVAMEGDLVEVRDGRVYVNGELWYQHDDGIVYIIEDKTLTLGEGEFFVIGDNGAESLDSRMIGVLNSRQMIARVVLRIFPFNRAASFY